MEWFKKIPKAKSAALTAGGAVLGWLATSTLSTIEEIERTSLRNQTRIEALEDDEAKWGTLAEQSKKLTELTIEIEVCKRLLHLRQAVRPDWDDFPAAPAPPMSEDVEEEEEEEDEDVPDVNVPEFRAMQESRFEKR